MAIRMVERSLPKQTWLVVASSLAAILLVGATRTRAADRPNVLLIICDDLNDWCLHPPDHPRALVPNLDRFRLGCVTFTNAHAVVPVCGPSRKCLFSGISAQTLDDYGFARWDAVAGLAGCVPIPLHFRNQGYAVYGTGKLLHEGEGGDFYTEYGFPPDYGPWPWQGKGRSFNTPHPAQYESWISYLPVQMHRDLNYGPLSRVPVWAAGAVDDIPGATGWFHESGEPFRYEPNGPRDRMPDERSADWAIDVLRRPHEAPFYLGVGFMRPHTPLYAPGEYFDRFPLSEISLPPYKAGDLEDCARVLRERWQWGYTKYEALIAAGGETAWREWVQAYLACTAFVDEQIGRVLDALQASGHAEDTIVLITADNGYHVGEKDCIQKWHLWDESTRVPLLIRVPGSVVGGKSCNQPVSLLDVYPTLVDLCGLPHAPNANGSGKSLQGYSLRPLLKNPQAGTWDGPAGALMAIRDSGEPPHFSLRTAHYRYTLCANGEEELYDHRRDPQEWTNLVDSPDHNRLKRRLRSLLLDRLRQTRMPENFLDAANRTRP